MNGETPAHTNAIRAVTAVYLRYTVERFCLVAILIALLIGGLAGFNAYYNGFSLLWFIAGLALGVALAAFAAFLLLHLVTGHLFSRRLARWEYRDIKVFAAWLQRGLLRSRTPSVLFTGTLLIHCAMNRVDTRGAALLEQQISRSPRLKYYFAMIEGYFREGHKGS